MTMLDHAADRRRIKTIRDRGILKRFGGAHNAVKTHCPAGHAYAGNNVAIRLRNRDGQCWIERRCVTCRAKQR